MEVIGREAELDRLSAFLVGRPWPRALVVEGEAGIGKTAVWRVGVDKARALGLTVLSSRPSSAEMNLSFAALGDLLSGEADAFLPQLAVPQQRALEGALALREVEGDVTDYRTLGLAVLGVLGARAEAGAFVVAIDDVQWLDAASARVLDFALRRLEDAPIGLLVTLRTDDAAKRRPVLDLDRLFTTPTERVKLGSLSVGALHELLRRRLDAALSRPMLVRVHAVARGNPFYALEFARALDDAADPLEMRMLPLTAPLREIVRRRLRRISPRGREMLLAATALSRPTLTVLGAWAGSDEPVAHELERARRAGIVEVESDRIVFGHPLLAAGIYDDATDTDRRRIHGELARIVSDPEERARHLARASSGPGLFAAAALKDAAQVALTRGAPDVALELLEEAMRVTPPQLRDEIANLELDAAQTAHTVGDHALARRLLERLIATEPAAQVRAQALVLLARVVHDYEAGAGLLYDARAQKIDDLRLRSEIERNLAANAWATLRDVNVALTHARAAIDLADAGADDGAYRHALAWLARLECLAGLPAQRAVHALTRGAGKAHGADEPLRFVQGIRFTRAETLYWGDELHEAEEAFERLQQEAEAVGNVHAVSPVLQVLALVLWRRGEWERARNAAADAVELARECGDGSGLAGALGSLGFVEAQLGHVDAARAAAAEGLPLVDAMHFRYGELRLRHALGVLELSLGNPKGALHHLGGVASSRWGAGYCDPAATRTAPDEVEALIAVGSFEQAREALSPFERHAEILNRRWAVGTSARCRGLLAAAAGDYSAAWNAFERALEVQRQLPEPYEIARTLLAYGIARRRAKSRAAAGDLLEAAASAFDALGAPEWARRARGDATRATGRADARDLLTSTERRVAELVAEGHTNKAVAAELFMSVKTVEANLSRIYRKLHIRSRTQLARRLPAVKS
jgi:DNA-binding CsgD family transcriptional regulator